MTARSISPTALARELSQQVQNAGLAPIWLITGSDDFLKIEALDALRHAARSLGFRDRESIEVNDRTDASIIRMARESFGLFATKKIVELRVTSGKMSAKVGELLVETLRDPIEDIVTIVLLPEIDFRTEKTKYWLALSALGIRCDCAPLTRASLQKWIVEHLAQQNQKATPEALEFFVDHTEGNAFAAKQEVEKLALLFPAGRLDLRAIKTVVYDVAHFEVDSLFHAIAYGEKEKIANIISHLEAQNIELPKIIGYFTYFVRSAIKLRQAYEETGRMYAKGVFSTARLKAVSQSCSMRKLQNTLGVLSDLDRIIKGVFVKTRDHNPWIELTSIAIFLAQSKK